jgi:predicted small metal-binding protein
MTQLSADLLRFFIIRCSDVGLDCEHVIFGNSEYAVMHNAVVHMHEYHAIIPEEMTTCMKLKIRENIHSYCDPARTQILYELSNVSEITLPVIWVWSNARNW